MTVMIRKLSMRRRFFRQAFSGLKALPGRRSGLPGLHSMVAASLLLAAGLSFAATGTGQAQGVMKSRHGEWALVCDTPPGASGEQCALVQNVVAEDRRDRR